MAFAAVEVGLFAARRELSLLLNRHLSFARAFMARAYAMPAPADSAAPLPLCFLPLIIYIIFMRFSFSSI